jgi:hypothetical protein
MQKNPICVEVLNTTQGQTTVNIDSRKKLGDVVVYGGRTRGTCCGACCKGGAVNRTVVSFVSVLTLAVAALGACAAAHAQSAGLQSPSSDHQNGLSAAFTKPATSALIAIHQAKQNIANVVSKNLPLGYYNPDLAAQAYDQVRQSQMAATTNGDQQAAALLGKYFTKVKTWAEQYKVARQSLNATKTMGENMLAHDSGWQAIESCEKAFNTMLVNRVYHEIASCE